MWRQLRVRLRLASISNDSSYKRQLKMVSFRNNNDIISNSEAMREVSMAEWVALPNKATKNGMSVAELPGFRLLRFLEDMAPSSANRRKSASKNSEGDIEEEESILTLVFEIKGGK